MKIPIGVLFGALVLVPSSSYAAEAQVHACTLLTVGEIGSAAGGQVGPAQESNITIPQGPSKDATMASCMWKLGASDMVSVSVIAAPQGAQREATLADLKKVFDGLRAKGWTEDTRAIGNTKCASMAPPPSQKDAPRMSTCMAEAKGKALSLGSMSPTKQVAVEQLKALLDKAIARLP